MSLDDIAMQNGLPLVGEDLKKIYESGIALISSKKQLNEILKVIAESVLEVFKADIVTLYQYDNKRGKFMGFPVTAGHLKQPEFVKRKPGQDDVAYQVVRNKANYYAEDAINDPITSRKDYPKTEGTKEHFIFRENVISSSAILLKQEKEVVGVMFINYRRFQKFSQEGQYLMNIFASYAAIAIRNARDKEELTKKLAFSLAEIYNIREQIETPYAVNQEASILQIVLNDILDFLDEKIGYFAEYDTGSKILTVKLASKLYQDLVGARWGIQQGITGYAVKALKTQYIADSDQNRYFFRFSDNKIEGSHTDADKDVKSSVTVPLILNNVVLGVFQFESKSLDGFSEYDREIIETMAIQAVNAIQNVRLLGEKELALRKISALHKLDNLIGSTWKLEAVFEYIMKNVIDLIKAPKSKGHISIVERIKGESCLVPHAISGYPNMKKIMSLDQEKGITRLAVLENRTVNVTDTDELWEKYYFTIIPEMRSELAVPLRVRGQSIGVLNVESPYPNAFDKEDEVLLETLAGQAVIVIMVTRLIEDIKNIGLSGGTKSKRKFLELILSKACELLGAQIGAIWMYEQFAGTFKFGAYLGVEMNLWKDMKLDIENSFIGVALKKTKIIAAHIRDLIESSGEFSRKNFMILYNAGLKSIISTPFLAGEERIGVMNIYLRDEIDITNWNGSWEKSLLELFAAQASVPLQNFERYAELRKAKVEIEQSVNKVIFDNLRQMLRLVTHRMNNSVGSIRADIIDVLEEPGKFDNKVLKKLMDIKEAAHEALKIPQELNSFVKKLKSDKAEVHIYDVIQDILQDKEFSHIRIKSEKLKNAPTVRANHGLLKEVFNELIQNASKAMPGGGEIVISAQILEPKMLEIRVKDTGHGISKENQGRMFDYGFTDWKYAKGTGDGLAIVRTVIEVDHEGKIGAESEKEKGCVVKLSLPLFEKTLGRQ